MRRRWVLLTILAAGFWVLGLVNRLDAQNATLATPASTSTAPKVIPKVEFNDISIEDAVNFLRDADPNFKAIVARDPDAPADYPKLSFLLNNVTAGETLTAIAQAYPAVELRVTGSSAAGMIIGPGGILTAPDSDKVIYVITVHAPPASAKPPEMVRVYDLQPLLGNTALYAANNPQIKGHNLKDILSLIQAVCDESDAKPTLHVHEATNTLIVKGTPAQQQAVMEAIRALTPETPSLATNEKELRTEEQQLMTLRENENELQRELAGKRDQELNAATQPANHP